MTKQTKEPEMGSCLLFYFVASAHINASAYINTSAYADT